MRRATRGFLWAGCALVVAIDAPGAVELTIEAWRGPYAAAVLGPEPLSDSTAQLRTPTDASQETALAVTPRPPRPAR